MTGFHRSVVVRALTTFCVDHRDLDLERPIRTGGDPDHASTDSITGSPGCWRVLLWHNLQNTGSASIDLVGTLPQSCGIPDVVTSS